MNTLQSLEDVRGLAGRLLLYGACVGALVTATALGWYLASLY